MRMCHIVLCGQSGSAIFFLYYLVNGTIFEKTKKVFSLPNGRYIDCSSLTYATNKSKTLKLQYRY